MTKRSTTIAVCCAAIAGLTAGGPAFAMRCGARIVKNGDTSAEVRHYCGEPVAVHVRRGISHFVERHGYQLWLPGLAEEILIEEWTYNFGPLKLMRVVRIENGLVTDVRELGYGFADTER
jgi:Protein of unknown function (DUF2845)